jgi:SAM-dependent methyltransferase
MTELAEKLRQKYFGHLEHPYRAFEREVERYLSPEYTLLDAGCGRSAPVLQKYRHKAKRLIGVDMVEFGAAIDGVELLNGDIGDVSLPEGSIDLVMSRSVMEHVENPVAVYSEISRVLKPGGHFVFLTANFWDYASLIAWLVPNRFHPWIVTRVEGRKEEDVFPIRYRTNTFRAIRKYAHQTGFEIASFQYLGQYPCYFMFNGALFFLATGYEKLINRWEALAFLRGWLLVALKKTTATGRHALPDK